MFHSQERQRPPEGFPQVRSRQVKDALARHAVVVNGAALSLDANAQLGSVFEAAKSLHERFFLVRLGKKKYHLFSLV